MANDLDDTDRRILDVLTRDGRMSMRTLAETLHISRANAYARLDRLKDNGEYVDSQALAPDGAWVRSDGEGKPPVTDGPFAETKDLIAGWMIIDVDSYERAVELASELSAAPGAGGKPIHEWLEVRPFMSHAPTVTE